ncbi:beta-lactamase class D [Roseateles sp. YR242]|uniref:class D beta-lactamase n=1 Tax=Roseateles sp. YR242 TaxID=1855305 RepID=UPI0008B37BD4|nr:class D beta-lactamase [Roseateles sp. YR242]SEK96158.1 beta-lactamase class D [Roseateles sp. YR242]
MNLSTLIHPRHITAALAVACLALSGCTAATAQDTAGAAGTRPSQPAASADHREPWVTRPELQRGFDALNTHGTLVLMDSGSRQWMASDAARAYNPYSPASTFKIPMSLIALETGVAKDENERFKWDGKKRRIDDWNQDQTLASAYKVSAVWVFQHLARTVGQPTVQQFLYDFRYGNAKAGPVGDSFWLDGDLRISAVGQVEFLRRLHDRELPLADHTYASARTVMRRNQGPGWTLYAKTGWSTATTPAIGWFVGWLERDRDPRPVYFALNMDMLRDDLAAQREVVVKDALRSLGYLD